jgi:serine/threonine-protein kinase
MGEAYLAYDPRDGREVLLKLPSATVLGDVAAHVRFERESDALRRLNHPGVQRLIDAGSQGLRPYIELEYVPGETLRELLRRRGCLAVEAAQHIAAALAEALAYCHQHGVVHRDLKPENVMLRADGQPVLIDFGSVLLEGARRLTYAKLSAELGTPEYMAPEQVQGRRGDARTDVYALGTLLYELLTGQPPFAAHPGDSAVQVMRRHLQETPPEPGAPGLSPALLGVLGHSLGRAPAERFQTMADFHAALLDPGSAVERGEVIPGWPPGHGHGTTIPWDAPLDEPQSLREWLRYVAWALATLAGLVAIGFLAAWLRTLTGAS